MEKDLSSSKKEVRWLRTRVSQLQQAQHVARSSAARAASTPPNCGPQHYVHLQQTQLWQQDNIADLQSNPYESQSQAS